jgi:serine/threonine protein kinase
MSTSNASGQADTSTRRLVHSKGVAHADLTGVGHIAVCVRNVLISSQNNVLVDSNGRAQIADYGLLTMCADLSGTSYIRSNVRWAAPELFEVPETDDTCGSPKLKSDIYSFGCIAYQVCQRHIFAAFLFSFAPDFIGPAAIL